MDGDVKKESDLEFNPSSEISPAYCVFKKNYSALINMLKSTDLYRYFVSEEIITPAENDEISAESNPLTKAQMFLQKVSSPLESGQTNSFYAVVDVMATYGNRSTKELARSINVTLHASVPDGEKSLSTTMKLTVEQPSEKRRNVEGEDLHTEKKFRENLTCPLCYNLYTDPKIIPCLHIFCKQCLENSLETAKTTRTAVCCPLPLCRLPLPVDKVESIPTYYDKNRDVEIFKVKDKLGDNPRCSNCSATQTIVMYCIECEKACCEDCSDIHRKWKAFSTHKIIEHDFSKSLEENKKEAGKANYCVNHKGKVLDTYCKTCHTFICQDCTMETHPEKVHDHCLASTILEEKGAVKRLVYDLKQKSHIVQDAVKSIEDCEKEIDEKSNTDLQHVNQTYEAMHESLQKQQEELVTKIKTIRLSLKTTLASQRKDLTRIGAQMNVCVKFYEEEMDNSTKTLLSCNNMLTTQAHELMYQVKDDSVLTARCTVNKMKVTPKPDSNPMYCIFTVTPNVPNCTICGPIVKPNQIKLSIKLLDTSQSPVQKQSSCLKILCHEEKRLVQDFSINEGQDGWYHMQYRPKKNISHMLSVYWEELQITKEIEVPVSIRDYSDIRDVPKTIDKYGPNNKPLKHPYLLAKGCNDELFFRDHSSKQIIVLDKNLNYFCTFAGEGDGNGKFQDIRGIAYGKKKKLLYATDGSLNCIQVFKQNDNKFNFITQFGCKGSDNGQFQSPFGLFLSQSGQLFICDRDNCRIQVFKDEKFQFTFGSQGKRNGCFNKPVDIAMNKNEDQLFITDCFNHRIQVFNPDGKFLKIFGDLTDKLLNPVGIYFSQDGHLLASYRGSDCVLVFEENGNQVKSINDGISNPCGVIVMNNGKIIISCGDHDNIVIV